MLKDFLLFCSGVHRSVLTRIDRPQEEEKYVTYGTAVLVTSSIATCSGGYALYAVFGTALLAVPFGLFWGGCILLLDRVLLMTMRKKRGHPLRQWAIAAPRLVLALFIGLTVSKPLELRLFKEEIQAHVRARDISAMRRELAVLAKTKKEAESEAKQALTRAGQLAASVIAAKKANVRDYQRQAARKFQEVRHLDQQIADRTKVLNAKEKSPQEIRLGLLEQIVIVEKLATTEASVRYTGWVLSTLFVLFEILPVLTKLMSKYSVYDAALESQEAMGIKRQETMQEAESEQIQQEWLAARHYRQTLNKAVLEELTRASHAQVISIIRQADAAVQMEAHQVDMVETATDRMTTEIKNAVKAPIESYRPAPSKGWDFSVFRQTLDRLFWHNAG